ncbi:hypothetical protein DYB37_009916 [Aphanomyces astaci]|uniref:TRP C-terminal domain-containing protein n=1 Tax=Aphanomyces astaci TaxID=112090 RepID=A0A418CLP3_APHAT|nr:hypothetical protein DYB35_010480 [Aphanomyces astaci]RHZ34262.1 hypothetical protein DYB37_009916 [Aphanomyces astaci]
MVCDEQFYSKWHTHNITCNGSPLDINLAVDAASCVAYTDISTCRALCTFPSCDGTNGWTYSTVANIPTTTTNTIITTSPTPPAFLSAVYATIDVSLLVPLSGAAFRPAAFANGSCANAYPTSNFLAQDCSCIALPDSNSSWLPTEVNDTTTTTTTDNNGTTTTTTATTNMPNRTADRPSFNDKHTPGHFDPSAPLPRMAQISQSTATASVAVTAVAVVSSTVLGATSSGAVVASSAVAASSTILVTLDIVQFGSLLNQLPLREKSAALASLGSSMKYAVFNFVEVGPGPPPSSSYRRALADETCADGICDYAVTLGISKFNLFVTTLVGIVVVGAAMCVMYGLAAGVATIVAPAKGYAADWFHHLVGAMVVLGLASQYAIGVTATYQVYLSITTNTYMYSFYLALASLLFLAVGILVFGIYIVRKHEAELVDVDDIVAHTKKPVARRYGALYDEYTFENRFFFAPKMLLALLCGMTTGAAFLSHAAQVVLVLGFHILFLVHLERCQPFQTPFMQHSMAVLTVLKILTLVLSIFLVSTVAGLSSSFHDGVSAVIVAIQLLVLVGLMGRQVVLLYQKYKAVQVLKATEVQQLHKSALQPLNSEQVHHMRLGRL